MTDAYQCDRCGEYNSGSGKAARVGKYRGTHGFEKRFTWELADELCSECYDELVNTVENFMELEQ